jgi:hypothetical protein
MTFDSLDALKNYILSKSKVSIQLAQERVYLIIHKFVKEYYAEYTPEVYERTYQLFRSLVKSGIKPTDNGWEAEVYFDLDALDYQIKHLTKWPVDGGYMNPYNGAISPDGSFSNPEGSAQKVMESAGRGEHGGYKVGTAIWTDPLIELWNNERDIFKRALIDAGIPVK